MPVRAPTHQDVSEGARATSRALAFGAWAARLSGVSLCFLSLSFFLPSVVLRATDVVFGTSASTVNQVVVGGAFLFFGPTIFTGASYLALGRGMAAGLVLCVAAFVQAILATTFASRAVRLMTGGRAACCACCACDCCRCCCRCRCCGLPPTTAENRLARARCSARAALALNVLAAVAAGSCIAAVSAGAAAWAAAVVNDFSSITSGASTAPAAGVAVISSACFVALAAAGLGAAHLRGMTAADFKNAAVSDAEPVAVVYHVVSARF